MRMQLINFFSAHCSMGNLELDLTVTGISPLPKN